jgi:hypothetical protein
MLRAAVLAAIVAVSACSASKMEVHAAQHSLYDADFNAVYTATLDAIRQLYPNLDDNPGTGKITTAWHQVQYASSADDATGVTATPSQIAQQGGGNSAMSPGMNTVPTSPAAGAAGMGQRLAYKKYYIRFEVAVLGGRPWRVKVIGHAAAWDVGAAMPTELHGAARPPWLTPRIEALEVEIYKKMKGFAIAANDEGSAAADDELPKTDPASFKDVPPDAARALAGLKDVLTKRDTDGLRANIADDVVWSLGGAPGIEVAMATWQADPGSFDEMAKLIDSGCAAAGAKKVACPGGDLQPGQYQLVVEPRAGTWKVTSFLKGE